MPSRAKNSHWMGTRTESEATRAFSVSRSSAGGQSIRDEVVIGFDWLKRRSQLQLAVLFVNKVEISSHEIPIGGGDGEPFKRSRYDHFCKFRIADQHIVESLPIHRLFDPEARRGVSLRVRVN